MKYLKLFKTETDRDTFLGGGDLILPNVSVVEGKKDVIYRPKKKPITFYVGNSYAGWTAYQAKEGMTFGEFINSQYNDGTFSVYGNGYIMCGAYAIYGITTDTIIENGVHYSKEVGGGFLI